MTILDFFALAIVLIVILVVVGFLRIGKYESAEEEKKIEAAMKEEEDKARYNREHIEE